MVDRVSNDHSGTACGIGVVQKVVLRIIASTGLCVVGWRGPDESSLGRGRTSACTAGGVADANGASYIDVIAGRYVDGGSSVHDQFRSLSDFDVALQVDRPRPRLGSRDGSLRGFVDGHGGRNAHHGQHERGHVEHHERH